MQVPVGFAPDHTVSARHCLVFDHIPKTAGTSFVRLLGQSYRCFYAYAPSDLAELATVSAWFPQLEANVAVAGHTVSGFDAVTRADLPLYYITFLRDPWSRFLSAYKFRVTHAGFGGSLDDLLDNSQKNYLATWIGGGDAQAAIERLESRYFAFGLVERFADSLALLRRAFDLPGGCPEAVNVSPRGELAVSAAARQRFEAENAADFALYAHAVRLFADRLAQAGIAAATASAPRSAATRYTPNLRDTGQSLLRRTEETPEILLELAQRHEARGEREQAGLCLRHWLRADRNELPTYAAFLARHGAEALARRLLSKEAATSGPDTAAAGTAAGEGDLGLAGVADCLPPLYAGTCACRLASLGRLEAALALLDRTAREHPLISRAGCLLARAEAYRTAGRPETALTCCREAVAADPSLLEAWRVLVDLLLPDRAAQALEALQQARLPEFQRPWLDSLRGAVLVRLGRLDAAEAAFREAAALAPDHFPCLVPWLARLRLSGRLETAVALLRNLRRADPDEPRIDKELAIALYLQGKKDEAWALLRQCRPLWPAWPVRETGAGATFESLAGQRLLLVHVAPLLLLDWLLSRLAGLDPAPEVTVLSPNPQSPSLRPGGGLAVRFFPLPPGFYLHDRDKDAIAAEALDREYQAAVLLTSIRELPAYREPLRLLDAVAAGRRLWFACDQLWDRRLATRLEVVPAVAEPAGMDCAQASETG